MDTKAETGPVSHDEEFANHHAMGVPMINNNKVTVVASLSVSQMAAISTGENPASNPSNNGGTPITMETA